jgi:hypothetical protein
MPPIVHRSDHFDEQDKPAHIVARQLLGNSCDLASANLLRACALESVTVQTQVGSLILSSSRAAMALQTNTGYAVIVQSFYGTHKKGGTLWAQVSSKSMLYIIFNF